MIAAVYKEALEYQPDHIAAIQSRPPFNVELHRRYNSGYSKLLLIDRGCTAEGYVAKVSSR